MMFALRQSVGCRFLALWQVMSLQGLWRDYVEAAFINGSWVMALGRERRLPGCLGWRIHQGCAMMPVAENAPITSWPWVPPHCLLRLPEGHWLSWKSACPRGVGVGKLLYAGLPLWGLLVAKRFRGLSSQQFSQPPNAPRKVYSGSHCLSPLAAGPLSCLIP